MKSKQRINKAYLGNDVIKINAKRLWIYFIAANILLLVLVALNVIPGRVFILQGQAMAFQLRERQLALLEENYHMYEKNVALLSNFQVDGAIIVQPSGHTGALLTDVRQILYVNNLTEQEFHASEHASHYVGTGRVTETRATIVADGDYNDIVAFVDDLANHYRYLRLERIQISEEFPLTRLWLTISIYEE